MLADVLTKETVQISEEPMEWEDAVRAASAPLLARGDIEQRYVERMVQIIREDKPYIMIADSESSSPMREWRTEPDGSVFHC